MTYLHFINLFNQYDCELRFSDGASRLYIKLLNVANEVNKGRPKGAPWVADFRRSDGYMGAVCGWSVNTLKKHRLELEKRGLVSGDFGQVGRNATGKYHLCYPVNLSNIDTFTQGNLSDVDRFIEPNLSDVDTFSQVNLSTSDTFSPESELNLSRNLSNVDTLIEEEEKKESSAASAAPAVDFSEEVSKAAISPPPIKPTPKKPKPKGATHQEIAELPLPFDGVEFAGIWKSFYTTNTKQSGKAITAFELMLKKLGKYPEGFAVVMLERAIMGDWQGVENDGTPRALTQWQAEQAQKPAPPSVAASAPVITPKLNEDFLAQQQAREEAEQAAHFAKYATA